MRDLNDFDMPRNEVGLEFRLDWNAQAIVDLYDETDRCLDPHPDFLIDSSPGVCWTVDWTKYEEEFVV
jgi:hypothetical protein